MLTGGLLHFSDTKAIMIRCKMKRLMRSHYRCDIHSLPSSLLPRPAFLGWYELKLALTRAAVNRACDENQMGDHIIKDRPSSLMFSLASFIRPVYRAATGLISVDVIHANALILAAGVIRISINLNQRWRCFCGLCLRVMWSHPRPAWRVSLRSLSFSPSRHLQTRDLWGRLISKHVSLWPEDHQFREASAGDRTPVDKRARRHIETSNPDSYMNTVFVCYLCVTVCVPWCLFWPCVCVWWFFDEVRQRLILTASVAIAGLDPRGPAIRFPPTSPPVAPVGKKSSTGTNPYVFLAARISTSLRPHRLSWIGHKECILHLFQELQLLRPSALTRRNVLFFSCFSRRLFQDITDEWKCLIVAGRSFYLIFRSTFVRPLFGFWHLCFICFALPLHLWLIEQKQWQLCQQTVGWIKVCAFLWNIASKSDQIYQLQNDYFSVKNLLILVMYSNKRNTENNTKTPIFLVFLSKII